jgi:hypothetical protein
MNKRARHEDKAPLDNASPFHYKLLSLKRGVMDILMSVPTDGEECPLTLDSMRASSLDFLPEAVFLPFRPLHSKLTLACGHSFSCMALLYSFCRNTMQCPCCRAGFSERMDVQCLPKHLREPFRAKVQTAISSDALEEHASTVSYIPYSVLAATDRLSLLLEFHETAESLNPVFAVSTYLRMHAPSPGTVTLEPRTDLRGVSNTAFMGVKALRLVIVLTIPGAGSHSIDDTPVTALPPVRNDNTMRVMDLGGSMLGSAEIQTRFSLHLFNSVIKNIVWTPRSETLSLMPSDYVF